MCRRPLAMEPHEVPMRRGKAWNGAFTGVFQMGNIKPCRHDAGLDVNRIFADAVARSGGTPTTELVGTFSGFKNVDFVVPEKRIVVEVKRPATDRRDAIIGRLSAEYETLRRRGLVPKLPQPMNWVGMYAWPADLRTFVLDQLAKGLKVYREDRHSAD